MKIAKLFTVSFIILAFFSCQKETTPPYSEKFEGIKNIKDASAKRIAFNSLSNNEKAGFWKYHTSKEMLSLSFKQREIVKEIYERFNPQAYVKNSDEHIILTTMIIPKWLKKSEFYFDKQKIADMFYFIEGMHETVVYDNNDTEIASIVAPMYDESAPDCLCNIGSNYTCKKTSIGFPSGITITYGSCNYSYNNYICDRDDSGCGFGGFFSCNGNTCTY